MNSYRYTPVCVLNNTLWKVVFSDGNKRQRVIVKAGDTDRLWQAIEESRQRLGGNVEMRVVSCYEAGQDGLWPVLRAWPKPLT